jgi:hypothetical protein
MFFPPLLSRPPDSYSAIFADSSTAPKRGYAYMADAKVATKKASAVAALLPVSSSPWHPL